uniref:Uncharacterized protein n=1 Tax=Magallana gigas TaxID=29159 RepID=K1PBP6_MAGGI
MAVKLLRGERKSSLRFGFFTTHLLAAFIVNDFASYLKQSLIEESGSDWTTGDHTGSDVINLRSNDRNWECKVLIPLSEYSKSVCVLWMFTEAFFLHQVVYGKYSTTRRRTGLYTLIGWERVIKPIFQGLIVAVLIITFDKKTRKAIWKVFNLYVLCRKKSQFSSQTRTSSTTKRPPSFSPKPPRILARPDRNFVSEEPVKSNLTSACRLLTNDILKEDKVDRQEFQTLLFIVIRGF